MNQILLGRFIPGDSIIHRLDPRLKLLACFYFVMIIFMIKSVVAYGLLFAFVLGVMWLSQLSLRFFIKGVKPLIWLIVFTVALQILFSPGQHVYMSFGIISISREGLINGAYIFCRFILIIFMSTLLTLTTSPLALSDAMDMLLRPFEKLGLPARDISLMLSIALRFIPTLSDEAEKIMNAQKARGVVFDEGPIFKRIKAMLPILIPLFVSSFNRAEELADAMEARGYSGSNERTNYRQLIWQKVDTIAIVVMVVLTLLLIILN